LRPRAAERLRQAEGASPRMRHACRGVLPERNRADLDEVPDEVLNAKTFPSIR
jgi:hypothetical protein